MGKEDKYLISLKNPIQRQILGEQDDRYTAAAEGLRSPILSKEKIINKLLTFPVRNLTDIRNGVILQELNT